MDYVPVTNMIGSVTKIKETITQEFLTENREGMDFKFCKSEPLGVTPTAVPRVLNLLFPIMYNPYDQYFVFIQRQSTTV